MIISIASGKGGTGKTTLSTNLAFYLNDIGNKVTLIDLDVEEPNCKIFIKPEHIISKNVSRLIPKIDLEKCTFCKKCSEICEFNAIAILKNVALIFKEICHSCGFCLEICPENAINEENEILGTIETGIKNKLNFIEGKIKVGEIMSPYLIKKVKKEISNNKSDINILDCPPGTSCPVIHSVKDSDFVILVTEPTPFGLNDLKLAVGMVKSLKIPLGVVINRSDIGDNLVDEYCEKNNIPIFLKIKNDIDIGKTYSNGDLFINKLPYYRSKFISFYSKILKELNNERNTDN